MKKISVGQKEKFNFWGLTWKNLLRCNQRDSLPVGPCPQKVPKTASVADRVTLPKKQKYIANFYTQDQAKALLDAIKGTIIEDIVIITIIYGLRRSEAVGLKWDAVNFENDKAVCAHSTDQVASVHLPGVKTRCWGVCAPLSQGAISPSKMQSAVQKNHHRL